VRGGDQGRGSRGKRAGGAEPGVRTQGRRAGAGAGVDMPGGPKKGERGMGSPSGSKGRRAWAIEQV
jgi:hypothetical protein